MNDPTDAEGEEDDLGDEEVAEDLVVEGERLEDGGEEDDPEVDEAGEDGHRLVGVHAVQEDGAAGTQKI